MSSRYVSLERSEWAGLRADTPLTLAAEEIARLRAFNERVSVDEVEEVYLPLSRLLKRHRDASRAVHDTMASFLGVPPAAAPYVIGIAGSVAVGKSTTARVLRELLSRAPDPFRVELVCTDGFLYPRRRLEALDLMPRKGFPESYDLRALIHFLADVKAGKPLIDVPLYSHLTYDIVDGQWQVVDQPEILIIEGLNILQATVRPGDHGPRVFVSDFLDFAIYVDAGERDIRQWYLDRFLALCRTAFQDPFSYFHRYATVTPEEALVVASRLWRDINEPNLRENILPTRDRAHLILEKGADHAVRRVHLRR